MTVEIEWVEEGNGYVGRWVRSDGDYGPQDIVIEPEGGLHGGWTWSFDWGSSSVSGRAEDADTAEQHCEACFQALFALDLDNEEDEA